MLRTINNVVRTLLFHSHLPPTYWVEAIHMASHLLNLLPSKAINDETPTSVFITNILRILTSAPSVAYATLTSPRYTNSPHAPPRVFS